MVVRVIRLGSERSADEGTRIGTVRRPPRGVPKSEFASRNWYDAFVRKYRAEMAEPEHAHAIALLASLSNQTDFSVGCYCEVEAHCHRSVLRELLRAQGADIADAAHA